METSSTFRACECEHKKHFETGTYVNGIHPYHANEPCFRVHIQDAGTWWLCQDCIDDYVNSGMLLTKL